MARMNRVSLTEVGCYQGNSMDAMDLKPALAGLAVEGIYVGTSSWKYTGWIGQLYDGINLSIQDPIVCRACVDFPSAFLTARPPAALPRGADQSLDGNPKIPFSVHYRVQVFPSATRQNYRPPFTRSGSEKWTRSIAYAHCPNGEDVATRCAIVATVYRPAAVYA